MESNNKPFNGYNAGADMWRDNVLSYGIDKTFTICNNYFNMILKREHSNDERQFCRELFVAMYEVMASKTDSNKIVYPYGFEESNKRSEISYYHMSRNMNRECSHDINEAIKESCYSPNYYNLENAAWMVLLKYGFSRTNAVLAHQIQAHDSDGRYSQANKEWARNFIIPDRAFMYLDSHATLVDSFTNYVRKLCADMEAERFALPGHDERGESVHGYAITRAIMVDYEQGYVFGHNPEAVSPYVCWQFIIRNSERHYNWGVYGSEQCAVDNYNARVFVALN